jgi:transposase
MKQDSKKHPRSTVGSRPEQTVGLDLGDRYSFYCVLTGDGDLVEEGRIQSTEAALLKQFGDDGRMRIALEAGTHSPWVSRLLGELGHEVVVANPRKIRAITASESKNDRNDAEKLARLAACDPKLLSPIQHRSPERQQDLNLIHARSTLVRARTMLVNALRGLVKSAGGRLGTCSTRSFPDKTRASIPPALQPACAPLVGQIAQLNLAIAEMDRQVEALGRKYPEIPLLRTVPGVGPIVAACYVLTLDRADAIADNRQAGAYLGLRPRQSQSGESNPQCGISKTGNTCLRSLLVQAAHYVLGRFGPDSALRRWGLGLAASGGKRGKKRAVVAVARKLAVLLHSMWRSGRAFEPFPATTARPALAA